MKNKLLSLLRARVGKGSILVAIMTFCLSAHSFALSPIDSTSVVTVGEVFTLDPSSTICRVYGNGELKGFICESTYCIAEDTKAFEISEKKRTKTLYYYKEWKNGYYSSYYVKALKAGEYTINAGARCHKTVTNSHTLALPVIRYKIIVVENVTSISIPNNLTLDVGDTYTFSPILNEEGKGARLTWTSNNPSIVSIDNGQITALTSGTAVITCTAANGTYAQCIVTVNTIKAKSISLNTTKIDIEEGMKYQLEATILPENTENKEIRWTCSNEDVALVSSNGMVMGFSSGDCEITATTMDGSNINAICKVHVVTSTPRVVTAKSYTRVYGMGSPQPFEYTIEGEELIGKPEITCEVTRYTPVGTYPIKISKGNIQNSNVKYVDGTFTVTKAPLTITAESCFRKVGEENPSFEVTYTTFRNNETDSVLTAPVCVTTDATPSSPCGKYEIKVTGGTATNYDVKYVNGTLTVIEPKEVEISNPTAGLLPTLISEEDKYAITKLTIDGLLNGTDIKFIREMIIDGYLTDLDIENTSIVAGGEPYNLDYYMRHDNIIAWAMFSECKNLQRILLPKNIVCIYDFAFNNCNIDCLVLPPSWCNLIENLNRINNLTSIVISYRSCFDATAQDIGLSYMSKPLKTMYIFNALAGFLWVNKETEENAIIYTPTKWKSWETITYPNGTIREPENWFYRFTKNKNEEYIQNHIKPLFTFKSIPLSNTSVKIECIAPNVLPNSYIDKYLYIIDGKTYETTEKSIIINNLTTDMVYDAEVHIYPAGVNDDYAIENFTFTMNTDAITDASITKWDIKLRNNNGNLQAYIGNTKEPIVHYSLCTIEGRMITNGVITSTADWQNIGKQIPHGLYLFRINDGKQTQTIKTLVK